MIISLMVFNTLRNTNHLLILEAACVSPVPPLPQHDAAVESLPVVLCCEKHVLKKSNSFSVITLWMRMDHSSVLMISMTIVRFTMV